MAGERTLTADHVVIAAGSAPIIPHKLFSGVEHCISSDGIFAMETLPKSMLVVGGGYIGVEMSQIMHAFGVKTTLLVKDMLLGRVDQEIVDLLVENMQKSGLNLKFKAQVAKVDKDAATGMLNVTLTDGSTMQAEEILLALGRTPNVEALGLKEVGIELESNGAVKVDEDHNTNVAGVYAIGDVTNNIQLTPVAIKAGRIVAERVFNNRTDLRMNYNNIATVIFSHPPIGSVGLTEGQAKAKYGLANVKIYRSKFVNMFYSLAQEDSKKMGTLFKLVTANTPDGKEELVVGAHGHGKGIEEMMQVISVAVNMGATKRDFDTSVGIHPTASEEWVLMDPKLY